MKRCSDLVAALGLALLSGVAGAQATPAGLWRTIDDATQQPKSLVRIVESGGIYSGRIERVLDPSAAPDARCTKCEDERRDQPIVGLPILSGVTAHDGDPALWDGGRILDPNNGKSYAVRLKPLDGGQRLEVRGYIGTPLIGRTQTWIRVE